MNTDQYKIQIKTPNSSILTEEILNLLIKSRKEIDETLNMYSGDITIPLFLIGTKGKAEKEGVFIPNNLDEYHPIGNTTYDEAINAYFKHETTHYITLKLWKNPRGVPPAFINEGVAQYVSEYFYVKDALGFGYDEITSELIKTNKYVPIGNFLSSDRFLELRVDTRILCENASFVGFLLREYGSQKLQELFETSLIPTKEDYKFRILSDFNRVYGSTLNDLENKWKKWLLELEENADAVLFSEKLTDTLPEFKGERCPSCSSFLKGEKICPQCGFDIKVPISTE